MAQYRSLLPLFLALSAPSLWAQTSVADVATGTIKTLSDKRMVLIADRDLSIFRRRFQRGDEIVFLVNENTVFEFMFKPGELVTVSSNDIDSYLNGQLTATKVRRAHAQPDLDPNFYRDVAAAQAQNDRMRARNQARIHWWTAPREAFAAALQSSKPLAIFFTGGALMDTVLYSDALVQLVPRAEFLIVDSGVLTGRTNQAALLIEKAFGVPSKVSPNRKFNQSLSPAILEALGVYNKMVNGGYPEVVVGDVLPGDKFKIRSRFTESYTTSAEEFAKHIAESVK